MSKYSTRPLTKFGMNLKTALMKKNMLQKELASQLGIKENSLIEIMRGARGNGNIKEKAEEILGVKL